MNVDIADVSLLDSWAEEEFGTTDLGDVRRTKRLIELAHVFDQRPSASLPDAAQDPAMRKAAYRFFDTDAVEPAEILASHTRSTQDRCASVPLILAIEDTTELDWSHHPATSGLGFTKGGWEGEVSNDLRKPYLSKNRSPTALPDYLNKNRSRQAAIKCMHHAIDLN